MPIQPINVLFILLQLTLMFVFLWSFTSYTEVHITTPAIKSYEKEFETGSNALRRKEKTEIQRVQQKKQEKEKRITRKRQTARNAKNLPFLEITENTPKDITDIMGLPPLKFDKRYKNPCFKGGKSNTSNPMFKDGELHCLPYFYILGVKKSGTSDLYTRLMAHREFQVPRYKESQWFPRIRFGGSSKKVRTTVDNRSVKFYISMFDKAVERIQKCPSRHNGNKNKNPCITADATPANFHMHTGWNLLPGNEGLTEPRYTNFHYIKHLTPDAKIIVIFRDPVTRLFSDFIHETRDRDLYTNLQLQKKFDSQSRTIIKAYKRCFKMFTMRRCIYNQTILSHIPKNERSMLGKSFLAGFYAFFMKEIFSVFRRNQVMTVNMNAYITYKERTLQQIFKFLKMSPLSSIDMKHIAAIQPVHQSSRDITMLKTTKDMLYRFYKPYNKQLATLLQDNSYLFKQPSS